MINAKAQPEKDLAMFSPAAKQRDELVSALPGGYWKHNLVDYVLLVNLYFPPAELLAEISGRLPALIGCYPSPHSQIAEQVGRLIGQPPDRIVLCNGVAEIIPVLLGRMGLSVVVPVPSFNPYEQAALPGRLTRFELRAPDFELDVDAFAASVRASGADVAVVVSPNNPTSRAVPKTNLLRLADTLAEAGQILIVDESFVEFSPQGRSASLEPDLEKYQNVVVLKSLGKIYGLCGLRMGYLLTSSIDFANKIKCLLPVWNVNTIAEFVLSRISDYAAAAEESWERVKYDRDQLHEILSNIPGMTVLEPHANFAFCEIPENWPDGPRLVGALLERHRLLVRHNGGKTMRDGSRYLRIAARSVSESTRLASALQETAEALTRCSAPRAQAEGS